MCPHLGEVFLSHLPKSVSHRCYHVHLFNSKDQKQVANDAASLLIRCGLQTIKFPFVETVNEDSALPVYCVKKSGFWSGELEGRVENRDRPPIPEILNSVDHTISTARSFQRDLTIDGQSRGGTYLRQIRHWIPPSEMGFIHTRNFSRYQSV